MTRKQFLYNLSRASYEKNWGKEYRAPSAGEKLLAFLFRLIPKIGPLKALALRTPTPQAEQLFERSFNATLTQYRGLLSDYDNGRLVLINENFDVGAVTPPGQYRRNDQTYAVLLDRLAKRNFAGISPELRAEILRFYSDPAAPYANRKDRKAWERVQNELQRLQAAQPPSNIAEAP